MTKVVLKDITIPAHIRASDEFCQNSKERCTMMRLDGKGLWICLAFNKVRLRKEFNEETGSRDKLVRRCTFCLDGGVDDQH